MSLKMILLRIMIVITTISFGTSILSLLALKLESSS